MSPAEKRVQIARDVVAQLSSGRLHPESGTWLTGLNESLFSTKSIKNDPEVKELLSGIKECKGCALGGMFMCAVERANKLKLSQLEAGKDFEPEHADDSFVDIGETDIFKYMRKFFTNHQLKLIEIAFEQGGGAVSNQGTSAFEDAIHFALDVDDEGTRMRLIMENIIANQGTFKPKKKPILIWQTPGFLG